MCLNLKRMPLEFKLLALFSIMTPVMYYWVVNMIEDGDDADEDEDPLARFSL